MADDRPRGITPVDAARIGRVVRHHEGGGDFTQPAEQRPRETPGPIRFVLQPGETLLPDTPADAWVTTYLNDRGEWIQTTTPVPGKVHAVGRDLCIYVEGFGFVSIVPGRRNLRCVLLADLPSNGTVQAAVLDFVKDNDVQAVKIIGSVNGGTFTITHKVSATAVAETTDDIAFGATGADVQTALEALPSIEVGDIKVDGFPGLWFIQFLKQAKGVPQKLTVDSTNLTGGEKDAAVVDEDWEDSGERIDIRATLPVGAVTPLKAGAIACPVDFGDAGYGFPGIEFRDFRRNA